MTADRPLPGGVGRRGLLAMGTLWQREVIRFVRDRHRLFGSVGQPLVFWLLVGSGLNASFQPAGLGASMSYLEYIYPGTLMLILLFTAIFSTISVVEDRREGFMQSVLVSPVPRISIVLGKVMGGTTLALLEAVIFLAFALSVDIPISPMSLVLTIGFLTLLALALTGLGFAIAWRMDSASGFHAVMNLFLLPLWLLSGAFFPPTGGPLLLQWVVAANPLTYGMAGLRHVLYYEAPSRVGDVPGFQVSLWVTVAFALLMVMLGALIVRAREKSGR